VVLQMSSVFTDDVKKGSGAKMRPSGIGGMAVMEGVMMKNKDVYAVAVRKPNNEIAIEKSTHKDISDKIKLFKLPIFRGMLAFVDSMVVGMKVLNYSASFFEEEEDQKASKKRKSVKENKIESKAADIDADFIVEEVSAGPKEKSGLNTIDGTNAETKKDGGDNALLMALAVLISIVISVALFMVLPVFITNLFSSFVKNRFLVSLIEGIVRLAIFIGYVLLASRMTEIKRVFMYHGAEHKTINCLEQGFELTVENVRWQSKEHKRCGTSFMLLVILISLIFFMILPSMNLLGRVLSRIILVPFIAGISYEFIRIAGKSESKIVNIISRPGMWMQALTTKEPDDSMIEVAIASVDAVFDWRAFLETSKKDKKRSNRAASKSAGKQKKTEQQRASKQLAAAKETASVSELSAAKEIAADDELVLEEVRPVKRPSARSSATPNRAASGKQLKDVKLESFEEDKGAEVKPMPVSKTPDEEDDEILKALDKYFDNK